MQNLLDERHITNAFVYIEGKQISFISLTLEQEMGEHHHFILEMDYDAQKKGYLESPMDIIGLAGKRIDFEFQQGDDNGGAYEFRGIIAKAYHKGSEGKHGCLTLEGHSTTILLEKGKRMDAFTQMTLKQVFDDITEDVTNNAFSTYCNPVYENPVSFLMQYEESDWEFLQRLSAISGETLYYTGWDLVFGKHKDWPVYEVMYDRELKEVCFGSKMLANTFNHYQYLPETHETITQESPSTIENANEYIDLAEKKNRMLVPQRPTSTPLPLPVEDTVTLSDMAKRRKTSTAAQTVYVTGTSKTCMPRIGRLLKIIMPEYTSSVSELGTYRVVKVKHSIDQNHHYTCYFEAIPASLEFYPTPKLKLPQVSTLPAMVVFNDDPENMGRVRVEFPFSIDRRCDTWMRVMTPQGGGLMGWHNDKGEIERNRGFVFIPEVGDQVMVGFEYGDPNRPYVMGSMFHGKSSNGSGPDNHIKSIITKSGHTLEFDDAEETMGITIKDKNGNIIRLDTAGKNIEITTVETMTLNAKNLCINVGENINVEAGTDVNMKAGGKMEVSVEQEIATTTGSSMNMSISEGLQIKAKDIATESNNLKMDASQEAKITGRTNATLKGKIANLSGETNMIKLP